MSDYRTIADWIDEVDSVVAFTGAGISTESGIPDFRSPGGIWSQSTPVYYNDFLRDPHARYEYWRQKAIAQRDFSGALPNEGHNILSRWESSGLLDGVITQNIDGLHQEAGSRRVLELHGTAREILCVDCDARFGVEPLVEQFLREDAVPPCPKCRGRLKHATISFGQSLSADVLREATGLARGAEVFVAIGSSLVVEPAASLPRIARENGAKLIIINRDDTPLDLEAHVVIRESIGKALTAINIELEGQMPKG